MYHLAGHRGNGHKHQWKQRNNQKEKKSDKQN
jgi:hypothetical protein